ncbi:MAG: prepilin-type N-terminal cleavage/methylation domain-containing protein [Candidatus Riflebacteria bacterium]|nr:prepilin-type N-terminal cleavage/methylation domain-containing protein [Candidatus Riflebacteria bacterium]
MVNIKMAAQTNRCKRRFAGFTLIETLIVLVVLAIICEAGFSVYSGVTSDYTLKTISDKLSTFFATCKQRAVMRNAPLVIVSENRTIQVEEAPSLYLRIPELDERYFPEKIEVTSEGAFLIAEKKVSGLAVQLRLSQNKTASVSIKL